VNSFMFSWNHQVWDSPSNRWKAQCWQLGWTWLTFHIMCDCYFFLNFSHFCNRFSAINFYWHLLGESQYSLNSMGNILKGSIKLLGKWKNGNWQNLVIKRKRSKIKESRILLRHSKISISGCADCCWWGGSWISAREILFEN
jgi:hypothetical protein